MPNRPLLVGFHGVKRSGKDTAASFLEEWARGRFLSFARRGFADKAKLAFARQFYPNISMEQARQWMDTYKDSDMQVVIESPSAPSTHLVEVPFRQCMAQFATEGARQIYGEDHWVDQLLPLRGDSSLAIRSGWWDSFSIFHGPPDGRGAGVADVAAITDIRFDNEVQRIRAIGGVLVKIRRREAEDAVLAQSEIHDSEIGIPDQEFDYVVPNNDTLDDFKKKIWSLAEVLIEEQFQGAGRESW